MGTKTEEEIAHETFKQELFDSSNWGLRRLAVGPKGAGIEVDDMQKAETTGPEAVIELIMEKYNAGWRPGGAPLNAQSKPASAKTSPKEKPTNELDNPPEEAAEEKESGGGDPWDDIGTDGGDLNLDNDVAEESDPEPEPDPKPEPQKQQRRTTKAKTPPADESSALEEKIDKILDTLMKMATVISKLEKAMNAVDDGVRDVQHVVIEIKEISTIAFGGLFNRLSIPKYGDVVNRAKDIAKKVCGTKD